MLANKLKILLAERDLSIKDVVNATGLTRPSISNMVNNPFANISTENIDKLCNYLEVAPKDFFDYSGWRFKYELLTDSLLSSAKDKTKELGLSIKILMTSGKLHRSFALDYVIEYDMDYGDGGGHDVFVTAYTPDGADKVFIDVYKKMSPLFKHQVESELLQPVPVLLEFANKQGEFDGKKELINVQFVYTDFDDDYAIFQDNFVYDRKNGNKTKYELD